MIDYALILTTFYKNAEWYLNGDDYSALEWLSETPKPSQEKLDSLWAETQHDVSFGIVKKARLAAYQQLADPLFFQFQAGEATEQEWLAARQEVVDANPYPAIS